MIISKPDYYDEFKCLADKCEDTCCAGWQIVIDDESLEAYKEVEGDFGERLRNSIDWEEGTFHQKEERRCVFLPNAVIPDNVYCTNSYEEALKDAELILHVTPSKFVRSTVKELYLN